ncbi:hypothetical protein ACFQZE_01375 [Paenibacillus sp. GCM10027627]|uniref:hypothetical protein n=1 Tax=unclassified Paenibacillus TaxID=185978 RepID=UPI00363BA374
MREKRFSRYLAVLLTVCMVMTMLPQGMEQAQAARAADKKVLLGNAGAVIGNLTYAATNTFINFKMATDGFSYSGESGDTIDWSNGDVFSGDGGWTTDRFVINVAANKTLSGLAKGGHAKMNIGFNELANQEECILGFCKTRITDIVIKHNGEEIIAGRNLGARHETVTLTPTSVIEIEVEGEGDDLGPIGARGLYIKFEDKVRPVMNDYTFTGNGQERLNEKINQMELYVKEQEHITLAYNFSEPVKPAGLTEGFSEHFLKHPLFTNKDGTGLPKAGESNYLINQMYTSKTLDELHASIAYKYIGAKYDDSGNNPLEPNITGKEDSALPMNRPVEQKLAEAHLTDEAGNVADISFPGKANLGSNDYLDGKNVNPFDFTNGGFRIIVDAVAPKYTKSGNGIQPEILTKVTVNNNDSFDFTVQLTEEATIKRGWDIAKTFIHFNNGMKAYYVSGENTTAWTFRLNVSDKVIEETPLLKAIAISNDSKGDNSDKNVIADYAGNLLIQPADFEGEHKDGNTSLVNSKIDWAELSIDNTKPVIGFRFEQGGATNQLYKKNGKVTINADDPDLKIPALDPLVEIRGQNRPSKGIFRPSNVTGEGSPSVGLVYYFWSQHPEDPFLGKEGDQFAAVKRYSLTAKQPGEDLYPEGFEDVRLQTVNNKTNMIDPPAAALTAEKSGVWYLHSWTADMSWDSARELMQYEKKKQYVLDHTEQYERWKAELPNGSEADRIKYADDKALAAVGQYDDLSIWPLNDFKKNDSNWSYNLTPFKLDNKGPAILFSELSGNGTMNVQVTTDISDEHSGLQNVHYQWVKVGEQPTDINWKSIVPVNGKITAATMNDIFEDGQYQFFVKASDMAGNERIQATEELAVVSSEASVLASFNPESDPNFKQSHPVEFVIEGITPDKVAYAFGTSSVRPSSESEYMELIGTPITGLAVNNGGSGDEATVPNAAQSESPNDAEGAVDEPSGAAEESPGAGALASEKFSYMIPSAPDKNGIYYIHVMAKQGDRYYYYSKAYYFDNEAPTVTFSKSGVAYPRESHDVTVTVAESYSSSNLLKEYQWVKEGAEAPTAASLGWNNLEGGGKVVIDNSSLNKGEVADFRLYVKAVDGAGNAIVAYTDGIFKVSKAGGSDVPPATATVKLIHLYGDEDDGYTAILKQTLATEDLRGYEYSISPDNGGSWLKWRPYTNFVSVEVPTDDTTQLQLKVKFRKNTGVIGEPVLAEAALQPGTEPVYATASLNTARPVTPSKGVDIAVSPPLGIKVVPSKANPSVPVRKGNTFTVYENGFYSFDLTDLNDPLRTETLYIGVGNIDGTAPQGTIEYMVTGKTGGNVTVQLASTSEPVVIVNNSGSSSFTFKENGEFTFQFRDEAGNAGSAKATVANIDKEAPKVKIVQSYTYGDKGQWTFGTIEDENGNVLAASGVKLEVVNEDGSAKTIKVLGNEKSVVMRENGAVSFTVADEYGNTTVVETEVNHILSAPKVNEIEYVFVDEDGKPVPAKNIVTIHGQPYAKGKVMVTLKGGSSSQNAVFAGAKPAKDDSGNYTNQISEADGTFAYSRIYSADGTTVIGLSDLLGQLTKVPVKVRGLDNEAPELQLRMAATGVIQNKAGFDFGKDLGGFTVSDNLSDSANIKVGISGLDLSKLGRQRVKYTAVDQVGNETVVYQDVVVVSEAGMLIFANNTLISAGGETALFNTNKLTFTISRHNLVTVNGEELVNEWGTYDLFYYSGMYREGEMKYIATKITYKELMNGQFQVVFPKKGWYTIVLRNQERERVYATFFIGDTE